MFAVFYNKGSENRPIYAAALFKDADRANGFREINGGFIRRIYTSCDRCLLLDSSDVSHDNCMYNGNMVGHSRNHCTANACF